jgi:antirestriction protein ArdC
LVADLCSAFSQAILNIRADIEQHASYLDSWQRVLKSDRYAFVKACSLACIFRLNVTAYSGRR